MASCCSLDDEESLRRAEANLLKGLPRCSSADVGLSSGGTLHHIELQLGGNGPPLVMLPGYGMGAGGYFLVLEAFTALFPHPFLKGHDLKVREDPYTSRPLITLDVHRSLGVGDRIFFGTPGHVRGSLDLLLLQQKATQAAY